MIGFWRASTLSVGFVSLLAACGKSPVETTSQFPPGVTGLLALVTTTPTGNSFEAELRVVDAEGNNNVIYSTQGYGIHELAWAPDGRHLAFSAPLTSTEEFRAALWEIGIEGGVAIPLFDKVHSGPEGSPRYSRSGRLAYGAGSGLPPYFGIFIDSVFAFPGLGGSLDWTPDEQALVLTQSTDLVRLNLADGSITRIWSSPGDTLDRPAVSPDGTRIAFLRHVSLYTSMRELWTVGMDGTAPIQLTTGYFDLFPVWTADGHYVAFSRFGTPSGVYLVPALGGNATRVVGLADNRAGAIAWSR
jgi:Tol biopolymer transport system component